MNEILIVFFLIGLAHWASHVMTCRGCLSVFGQLGIVLLEGVRKTLGWPLALPKYFFDMKHSYLPKNTKVVELKQNAGESLDDFTKRAVKIAQDEIAKGPDKKTCSYFRPCNRPECMICSTSDRSS